MLFLVLFNNKISAHEGLGGITCLMLILQKMILSLMLIQIKRQLGQIMEGPFILGEKYLPQTQMHLALELKILLIQ